MYDYEHRGNYREATCWHCGKTQEEYDQHGFGMDYGFTKWMRAGGTSYPSDDIEIACLCDNCIRPRIRGER